jgi:predicted nucleic acid-binding Zn ribbon protein
MPDGLGFSESRLRRLDLERAWREAVGASLAARVHCEGIRHGILELRADDPAWARAVREHLPRIAARLGEARGVPKVVRVRIAIDGGPAAAPEPMPEAAPSR